MYITREIEPILTKAVKQFPSVIVTGPRQSGKSTLLQHLFSKNYKYVTLDNMELRLMAKQNPAYFLESYPPPLIIDEIQYAPDLLSYIKIIIDKDRTKKGRFLLTGSQIFPLMKNVSESLAGRIAVLNLLSFSYSEQYKRKLNLQHFKRRILTGGFPGINIDKTIDNELWFESYLQTYLERDVRHLRNIGDLTDFQRFLQLVVAYNGQVMNLSNISRDLGIAVNTVKAWISVLEASGQIISIKPYYMNKGKRITKNPKIYFLDTGLVCHLTGVTSVKQVFKGPLSGQLFETVILGEIVRWFYNKGKVPKIYYWRTSHGEEVDFIIEYKGEIIPVEIKLASHINDRFVKSLSSFNNLFGDKINKSFLVSMSNDTLKLGDKIFSIPYSELIPRI